MTDWIYIVLALVLLLIWKTGLLPVGWILALAAIFAIVRFTFRRRQHIAFIAELKEAVSNLGLQFEESTELRCDTKPDLVALRDRLFEGRQPSFGLGYRYYKIWDSISGHKSGTDISIFRLLNCEDDEDFVFGFLFSGFRNRIPPFDLFPENFLNREHGPWAKDIDFDLYPEFSSSYTLHGSDPEALRNFFTDDLLTFFTMNTDLGSMQVRGDTLCFVRRLISGQDLETFLEKALVVKQKLDEAASSTTSRRNSKS